MTGLLLPQCDYVWRLFPSHPALTADRAVARTSRPPVDFDWSGDRSKKTY